ncbi:MAG: cytidyltransferase [Candidatus Omnitrophota bacterium]|nr:MAG: cytidyltransferase [Candidatus Omnitrophota bacterium]
MKDIYSKIKNLSELALIIKNLKKQHKKIVHCHGVFDLLHPGHIKHFAAAKKEGDILVVTVTRDEYVDKGPGRPVFNEYLRAESIAAIECVDFVAINEWPTAIQTIRLLKPDFYVKGRDYAKKEEDLSRKIFDEERAIKSVSGRIIFTDEISFSSSTLINTFLTPYPEEAKEFFERFKKRYSAKDMIETLQKIRKTKVLVIGDAIIDEYHYCVGLGKSQKDNIIATKFLKEEVFAGGVLAAANHLAGFCEDVTLLTCIGNQNNYRSFIDKHLKPNIKTKFFYRNDAPTVVKRRFVDPAFLNKLFEICYLKDTSVIPKDLEEKIKHYLEKNLKEFDMALVADFGHGLITPRIVKAICKSAKYLALNVQTNSANIGFNLITKFPRADYICIDEPELRLACHDKFSDLKKLVNNIHAKTRCGKIIITRGHKGSLVFSQKEGFREIPVFSKEVVDRIGAGDAYFSVTSPCALKNIPIEMLGFIGNAAGAIKVLIVGNRASVEPIALFKYITTLLK